MSATLREPWDDPAYQALREHDMKKFNDLLAEKTHLDLSNCYLRGVDLQNVNIKKIIISGSYLKNADLRGLDLRQNDLEGASIHGARISGTWLPSEYSSGEIRMSIEIGTRLRKGL